MVLSDFFDETLWSGRKRTLAAVIIIAMLAVIVMGLYWQVKDYDFVLFDDPAYVRLNFHVRDGLSLETIKWAFHPSREGDLFYWHPLTWISHALDCQLFDVDPGKHHLSSVIYHILNAIMLFIALRMLTGSTLKSSFVALLFAIHPVNVDSVAWIAERKNLLSTFFWMLTIIVYIYYTRKPNPVKYLLVLFVFILGLLSKPMLVTVPFVLLLLDYWPLKRIQSGGETFMEIFSSLYNRRNLYLFLEKVPLIVLSLALIVYSMHSLAVTGQYLSGTVVPIDLRIKNAIVSYVTYILKMLWPANLTFYYPYPTAVPMIKVIGALFLIISVTVLTLKAIRKYPYLAVGWLWFAGTILPVSGLSMGGLWPEIAERWAYVPHIGLFIMIAWGVPDLLRSVRYKEAVLGFAVLLIAVPLCVRTWVQIGAWKDDETLCRHGIQVNYANGVAHANLAVDLINKGDVKGAIHECREALRINPAYANVYFNLGLALVKDGKDQEAIEVVKIGLKLKPNHPVYLCDIGFLYLGEGSYDNAIEHFNKSLKYESYNPNAHFGLGNAYAAQGKFQEAIHHLNECLKVDKKNDYARTELNAILAGSVGKSDAVKQYTEILKKDPKNANAHYRLGKILAEMGSSSEALKHLTEAVKLDAKNADARYYLGLTLAGSGRQEESLQQFQEALRIDPKHANANVAQAVHLQGSGRNREALTYVDRALEAEPKNAGALYNRGVILAELGKKEEAVASIRRSIEIDPKNADARINLGTILAGMGRIDEASLQLSEALKIDPGNAQVNIALGDLRFRQGNYDEAVTRYSEAVRINPRQAAAYNKLGTAYIFKENLKKAIENYELSLREDPSYAGAIENLKNARSNQAILQQQLERMKTSLKSDPNNAGLHVKIGDINRKLGNHAEAVAAFNRALELKPGTVAAVNGLVMVYTGSRDYEKAISLLQSIRQAQPGNAEIYYNIACLYARKNMADESVVWLRQAMEKGFNNWDLIRKDPDLNNIRQTSFYRDLMNRKKT